MDLRTFVRPDRPRFVPLPEIGERAPDLPGFGLSDFPTHPLDVPGLAEALRRWMLDNEIVSAAVVAVSTMDAELARELARPRTR